MTHTGDSWKTVEAILAKPKCPQQVLADLTKLAHSGRPEVFAQIGNLYERGHVVPKDLDRALQAYQQGLDRGDYYVCPSELARIYFHGRCGIRKNLKRAYQVLREAATKSEYPPVCLGLGILLLHGLGCQKDLEEAKEWLWRAWQKGNIIALGQYGRAISEGGNRLMGTFLRIIAGLYGLPYVLFDRSNPKIRSVF